VRRLWDDFAADGARPVSGRRRIRPQDLLGDIADLPPEWDDGMRAMAQPYVEQPVIVAIDNVSDYFHIGTDKEFWDLRYDFPNIAPPWPNAWYEYTAPPYLLSAVHGRVDRDPDDPTRYGTHVLSVKRTDDDGTFQGWECMAYYIAEYHNDLYAVPWRSVWKVTPDGQMDMTLPHPDGQPGPALIHKKIDLTTPDEAVQAMTPQLMYPMWLANSFAHCKNVESERVTPPRKLAAKHAKRGRPLHDFHVLKIEPMVRRVEASGAMAPAGERTQQGLHIRRGEFRDYRERGLFGRHKGVFWFDAHVRGSGPRKVDKTYDVRAPKP